MKKRNRNSRRFVICVDNSDYPASLELHKVYTALPDDVAADDDLIRVIDESGEDYLYSAQRFVSVELPPQVKQSIIHRVRETTTLANRTPTSRGQRRSKSKKSSRTARG